MQVFISYARNDKKHLDSLVGELNRIAAHSPNMRLEVVYDQRDIAPGEDWDEKIRNWVNQSDHQVVLLTERYTDSGPCLDECGDRLRIEPPKSVIPVLV